jgi:small multidrug resistance family-3 protein
VRLFVATGLFTATAFAEIVGCWLVYLCVRHGRSWMLLVPAAASLATFAWLLSLHPTGAARTYAAYGGVYVTAAIAWLWLVERERPTATDLAGAAVTLVGMAIIVLGHRPAR